MPRQLGGLQEASAWISPISFFITIGLAAYWGKMKLKLKEQKALLNVLINDISFNTQLSSFWLMLLIYGVNMERYRKYNPYAEVILSVAYK